MTNAQIIKAAFGGLNLRSPLQPAPDPEHDRVMGIAGLGLGGAGISAGNRFAQNANKFVDLLGDTSGRLSTLANYPGAGYGATPKATQMFFHDVTDSADQLIRLKDQARSMVKYIPGLNNVLPDSHWLRVQGSMGILGHVDPSLASKVRGNPALMAAMHSGGPIAGDATGRTWKQLDTSSMLRRLGFKDFDRIPDIRAKVPELQAFLSQTLKEQKPVMGMLERAGRHARMAGRAGQVLGGLGALWGLHNYSQAMKPPEPWYKSAAMTGDGQTDWMRNAQLASLLPGTALTASGLYNHGQNLNNILVTYGENDVLGAGHKTPGDTIAEMLRKETPYNVTVAPTGQSSTRSANPDFMNRRYAASVDTGWGLTDPNYNPSWAYDGRPTGNAPGRFSDKMEIGQGLLYGHTLGNRELDQNIGRKIKFHPDPPAATGHGVDHYLYPTHGNAVEGSPWWKQQLAPDRTDFHHITYGRPEEWDPKLRPYMESVGPYHPGVAPFEGAHIKGDDYHKLVSQAVAGDESLLPALQGKKILAITGASRGDTVGARMRRIHDALTASGDLDKYYLLGLGGKNAARERLIAEAGGGLNNAGFVGFTPRFRDLANNADLHYMGMGGATPMEMLSHGGAPIITDANEQEFLHQVPHGEKMDDFINREVMHPDKGIGWGKLQEDKGMYGYERNLVQKLLGSDAKIDPFLREQLTEGLKSPEARGWMNPIRVQGEGETRTMARGLDYVRSLLDRLGVHQVETPMHGVGTAQDPLLKIIHDATHGDYAHRTANGRAWGDVAQEVNTGLKDARKNLLQSIITQAERGKTTYHMRNLMGRTLPGAALMGFGLMPAFQAYRARRNGGLFKSGSIWPQKKDSTPWGNIAGTGAGAALTAGGLRGGQQAQDLFNVFDRVRTMGDLTYGDPKSMLQSLQEYGDASQKLINGRMLGPKNLNIVRWMPPSRAMDALQNPREFFNYNAGDIAGSDTRLGKWFHRGIGKDRLAFWNDAISHYKGFAKDPAKTISEEIVNESFSNPTVRSRIASSGLGPEYIQALHGKGSLMERFAPLLKAYEGLPTPKAKADARYPLYALTNFLMGSENKWKMGPLAYSTIAKKIAAPVALGGALLTAYNGNRLLESMNKKSHTVMLKLASGPYSPISAALPQAGELAKNVGRRLLKASPWAAGAVGGGALLYGLAGGRPKPAPAPTGGIPHIDMRMIAQLLGGGALGGAALGGLGGLMSGSPGRGMMTGAGTGLGAIAGAAGGQMLSDKMGWQDPRAQLAALIGGGLLGGYVGNRGASALAGEKQAAFKMPPQNGFQGLTNAAFNLFHPSSVKPVGGAAPAAPKLPSARPAPSPTPSPAIDMPPAQPTPGLHTPSPKPAAGAPQIQTAPQPQAPVVPAAALKGPSMPSTAGLTGGMNPGVASSLGSVAPAIAPNIAPRGPAPTAEPDPAFAMAGGRPEEAMAGGVSPTPPAGPAGGGRPEAQQSAPIDWNARFAKAHGSAFVPTSKMDRWKMQQLQAGNARVGNKDYRMATRHMPSVKMASIQDQLMGAQPFNASHSAQNAIMLALLGGGAGAVAGGAYGAIAGDDEHPERGRLETGLRGAASTGLKGAGAGALLALLLPGLGHAAATGAVSLEGKRRSDQLPRYLREPGNDAFQAVGQPLAHLGLDQATTKDIADYAGAK